MHGLSTAPIAKAPYNITLGLFSIVCGEERQRAVIMHGLSTAQRSHHQEQVSPPTH
jgi:hypothetical protein